MVAEKAPQVIRSKTKNPVEVKNNNKNMIKNKKPYGSQKKEEKKKIRSKRKNLMEVDIQFLFQFSKILLLGLC